MSDDRGRGVKMMNSELPSERVARASLQRRRNTEAERRGRIFNDKVRTIGLDLEGLDTQVKQRKRLEEAEEEKQKACDAEMLHNSKVACILHNREVKKRRATETAIANFRHQYQQPCSQRDFDLNDPDRFKKTSVEDAQMMPPGLVGEDPESKNRLLRQREQLREWLVEQQGEQAADRRQRMLEEQRAERIRAEMDDLAQHLQSLEMERRRTEAVATKEFNLAKIEEKRRREQECNAHNGADATNQQLTGGYVKPTLGLVGPPGLCPSCDRRDPPEDLQQVIQFQKYQIEEKKRIEFEKKREEERHDRVLVDSARAALLLERQQAKLNRQLRRQLDSTNVGLAEAHKRQESASERGRIDDSFFSNFNTCSR